MSRDPLPMSGSLWLAAAPLRPLEGFFSGLKDGPILHSADASVAESDYKFEGRCIPPCAESPLLASLPNPGAIIDFEAAHFSSPERSNFKSDRCYGCVGLTGSSWTMLGRSYGCSDYDLRLRSHSRASIAILVLQLSLSRSRSSSNSRVHIYARSNTSPSTFALRIPYLCLFELLSFN
ncbi:hypothetical protein B0H15DRAFT_804972 [Mycena belliarum]|uniref:Uncharacterized protein n=1 Tax=Mycena belliarum TaxID=1033014 RepID=A0AAD6TWN4_9AGAR|nr:hypothetical protein B0H15DRAFT_804972 [Mycena belliae]